jgi:hypothetical protein
MQTSSAARRSFNLNASDAHNLNPAVTKITIDRKGGSSMQQKFITTPKARKDFCRHHPKERVKAYWCCECCPCLGFDDIPCKYCEAAKQRNAFNQEDGADEVGTWSTAQDNKMEESLYSTM